MYKKYLLTGATGYLGGTVLRKLIASGASVSVLVMPGDKGESALPDGVMKYYGSVGDATAVEAFIAGAAVENAVTAGDSGDGECASVCESSAASGENGSSESSGNHKNNGSPTNNICVIHCAGIVSIASKPGDVLREVNVGGTVNVVDMCKKYHVSKLVYVSSVHAIPEKPKGEVIAETRDFSPEFVPGDYAKSKAEATAYVLAAAADADDALCNLNSSRNTDASSNLNPSRNTDASSNLNPSSNLDASSNLNPSSNTDASSNLNPSSNTDASSNFNPSSNTDPSKNTASSIPLNPSSPLNASVVHPSGIIGPFDAAHGSITGMILRYITGKLPVAVRGGYDFVDVRDVADGVIACAERGVRGECYILSGRYVSIPELLSTLRVITHGKRLLMYLPLWIAKIFAPAVERRTLKSRKPLFFTPYSIAVLGTNAVFSNEKARRDLGFSPRSLAATLRDTVAWLRGGLPGRG